MPTNLCVHQIKAIRAEQKQLPSGENFYTSIFAKTEAGEEIEFCMFHVGKPVQITGAEFVNFTAQPAEVEA